MMSESIDLQERIRTLETENERLFKVNEALMNRVERSTDAAGSAYSLFESNLLLQNKIKEHTDKLVQINRDLQREIREHKRTEEKLRMYHRIFMASKDSIGIMTLDGTLIEMNPAAQLYMSQLKENYLLPEKKTKIYEMRRELIEKAMKDPAGQHREEFRYELKDGGGSLWM